MMAAQFTGQGGGRVQWGGMQPCLNVYYAFSSPHYRLKYLEPGFASVTLGTILYMCSQVLDQEHNLS